MKRAPNMNTREIIRRGRSGFSGKYKTEIIIPRGILRLLKT